jgi:hypothetical protein
MSEDEMEVARLVGAARSDLPQPDAIRALRARVDAARTTPSGAPKLVIVGGAGVVLVGALVIGVLAGREWLESNERSSVEPSAPPSRTETASDPPAQPALAPPVDLAEVPVEEEPARRVRSQERATGDAPRRERPAEEAVVAPALPSEIDLVTRARRELGSSPRAALATLAEHRTHYPRGMLAEERDALEVHALARLGRPTAARARAFMARYPRSVHRERVLQVLEAEGETE